MKDIHLLTICLVSGCLWQRTFATFSAAATTETPSYLTSTQTDSSTTITESTTGSPPDDQARAASATGFLLSKRKPSSYGWERETHRALTALALAGALPSNNSQNLEEKLMVKELELQLALAVARHHQEPFTTGQLALYINALLSLCRNPRDFYGMNLVAKLYHKDEAQFSYSYSLQSLALCNAGVKYDKARILKLIEYIKEDPSEHGDFTDNLAMTTLALGCEVKQHPDSHLERYLNRAVKKLKQAQKADGSFGNIYSSALTLQALMLSDGDNRNWNPDLAREYIYSQQHGDGSFVDFMGTYFSLPILLNRTFASLAHWDCYPLTPTEDSNGDVIVTHSPELNGTQISVGLLVRAPEVQEYRIPLLGSKGDNLYNIITANSEFVSVEFKDTAYGHMIVGVDGLNQDPSKNKYWLIYVVEEDGKETSSTTGVDGIFPKEGDDFVFELKTFN